MTPEHLRETIANAVRLSVRSGMQHRRRTDLSRLQLTCIGFTAAMVDPVIEALIEQTAEEAVREACRPYADGNGPPPPTSPLWVLFTAGALCTLDQLSDVLGVRYSDLADQQAVGAEDLVDLIRAHVEDVLENAGLIKVASTTAEPVLTGD